MQINNSKKKSKKKKVIIQLTLQVQVGTQTRKFNVLSNDHNYRTSNKSKYRFQLLVDK